MPAPTSEPRLFDLRELGVRELAPILESRASDMWSRLYWDCRPSIAAVQRLLDRRTLHGRALVRNGSTEGYCYYVPEGNSALIGDLFVRASPHRTKFEQLLFASTLDAAAVHRGVERVEGQLLSLSALPDPSDSLGGRFQSFSRRFMAADAQTDLPEPPLVGDLRLAPWSDADCDAASALIAACFLGHVDSRFTKQYGERASVRDLLVRITQHGANGPFCRSASFLARAVGGRTLHGLCLGSFGAEGVGHVEQLCVAPAAQGRGLGTALLRRSMDAFRLAGCKTVTLTVTAANSGAVALYRRCGFRELATFPAFAWRRG